MSVQAMAWALSQRVVTDPTARHVLLCLANYANEKGEAAFPSISTLVEDTGLSARTVQYKIGALEEAGVIRRGNQAIAAAYIDRHDRLPVVYDLILTPKRGAAPAPREVTGCNPRQNGVQMKTERGAAAAPNPSLIHQGSSCLSGAGAQDDDQLQTGAAAGHASIALRKAGFAITSQDPRLLAAVAAGVTADHLTEVAALPECSGKPASYVVAIALRQATEPAQQPPGATHAKRPRTGESLTAQSERINRELDEREARNVA